MLVRRFSGTLLLAIFALYAPYTAPAAKAENSLAAKVGKKKLTRQEIIELIKKTFGPDALKLREASPAKFKQAFSAMRDQMIVMHLIELAAAEDASITKDKEVLAKIKAAIKAIYSQAYLAKYIKVSDASLQTEYKKNTPKRVTLSQIIAPSAKEARRLHMAIKADPDNQQLFQDVQKKGLKDNAGNPLSLVPSPVLIDQLAFLPELKNKINSVSKGVLDPIGLPNGQFIIVRVDSKDDAPLAQAKPLLMQRGQAQKMKELALDLKNKFEKKEPIVIYTLDGDETKESILFNDKSSAA